MIPILKKWVNMKHSINIPVRYLPALLAALLCFILSLPAAVAAPKAELWARWQQHNPESERRIDHGPWADFLEKYLITDHPSGVNLVPYDAVIQEDKQRLDSYLDRLQEVPVSTLNRAEQKAFWINAYNALTVQVLLDHYPVDSIRDIDLAGWFTKGPWQAELLTIEGIALTLDDIEHRILRPIWQDNRIHYGVNCASIGCPDLQDVPFTAQNTEELLDKGAREHVNHPRGARFKTDDTLVVSSIYDWFQEDFNGSVNGVLEHLVKYAEPPLADRLRSFSGDVGYEYDWSLNEP